MLFCGSKNCTWNWLCGGTIIPQYETEEFIQEGLKEWNPGWSPQFFMTDKSAQELGTQLYVDAMYSINNELFLLYVFH